MGAGRIIRDKLEGLIIDPLNVDEVAGAISTLAENQSLGQSLGVNASVRAKEFTWPRVGGRLHDLLYKVAEPRLRTREAPLG